MSRGWQQYRVWGLTALAVALLLFGAISFYHRVGMVEPVVGVTWVQATDGPVALGVDESGIAWNAGLRAGDLLLAIDGQPVESAIDAEELGWRATDARPISVEVGRGLERLELSIFPDWQPRPEPYTYLSIAGLAFWVSGLFIALRWPLIRGGVTYTLLAFCLFAHLNLSHTGRGDGLDLTFYWGDLISEALAPAILVHLGVQLTKRTVQRRTATVAAAYLGSAALILVAVWLSPIALGGAYRFRDPVLAVEVRDRLAPLFFAVSLILTTVWLAKSHHRSASATHRSQMRWLLWGFSLGLGPFVVFYAVPWALAAPELPTWAQFLAVVPLLFVPAACTTALARYRLHDLDVILVRGFAEVSAVFCAFGIYAATVFLFREGLSDWLPMSRSGSRYIGLLAMVVAYPPVRSWVRRGVDRAFYKKRYSYRATLLDWARELSAETDLPSLLQKLRRRIRETLGVPVAEVLLDDGRGGFTALGAGRDVPSLRLDEAARQQLEAAAFIDVQERLPGVPWARYVFSMTVKDRLSAVLAVAERGTPDEPLTIEDRALLTTLAAHAATAIEAARLVLEVRSRAGEIERLHARQARILEGSAVGLLLLDGDGRIQAWNRALEQIYGLPRSEALGRRMSEVFPLHVVRRIERQQAVASADEEVRIFRLSVINKKGNRVVANLTISPVDRAGEERASVVTIDDVSGRVKLEEQVLRQERLASLGLLAAGVAHEINTPLTGISSYAQMMLEECSEGDPRRPILRKIERQTDRASRITNSLLNLARPEQTALEALDVNETIDEVLQLFEPQVRGGGVRLNKELDGGLPQIPGHKGKLQQVLLNLLINARDAVGEGGRITIKSGRRPGKVLVEIIDDGVGIAEEDLPSIFDPFFTTKGRGQGTGLGLSLSYGIVREHEGEIHVESRPGEFTRFLVELPTSPPVRAMA